MRQLAAAIEGRIPGRKRNQLRRRARRLATVFHTESCWLVSADGAEAKDGQWKLLEEVLAAKRARNDRLPIFLFGDERTAEMVPASVLKHANAFMRLFEDSPEFLARTIARSAELYLERLAPPMFKALVDYTLHASYSSAHARTRRRGRVSQESGRQMFTLFGENTCVPTSRFRSGRSVHYLITTGPDRGRRTQRGAHIRLWTKHCL